MITRTKNISQDIKEWNNQGFLLEQRLLKYNWDYRKKICVNCNKEKKERLNCLPFNSFKDGLQETHCRNLIQARTKKFKKEIMDVIGSHPLAQSVNDIPKSCSVTNKISE